MNKQKIYTLKLIINMMNYQIWMILILTFPNKLCKMIKVKQK